MTSDEKTLISSLINYVNSDLFTLENLSSSITLTVDGTENIEGGIGKWKCIIDYLPMKFYQLIESYPNMFTIEDFDKKYLRNPKMCAFERYGSTNMWRPLMILNRCPSINKFDFEFIRYFNISTFSNVLSVLIARVNNE